MMIFNNNYVTNVIALFTGLIIFNMSFFLAEVSALKLTQDKKMIENIVKLISSSAPEEEKDVFGGSAGEEGSAKEVDLIFNYSVHTIHGRMLLIDNKRCAVDHGLALPGSYEIYSPPPEA